MRKPVKDDISGDAIGIGGTDIPAPKREGWGGLTIGRPIVLIAALSLGACANFQADSMKVLNDVAEKGKEVGDTALKGAASAVDVYCGVTPETVKAWFRGEINERTKKYEVELVCKPKA